MLLRTPRGGGRVGELTPSRRLRLLRARFSRPVELIDGLQPAPYLGFATRNEVGAINELGLITLVHLTSDVSGIAFDRFGRLWYASRDRHAVGRLDPIHGTQRTTHPAGSARFGDLVTGPGGGLVLRDERGQVGRISQTGRVVWESAGRVRSTPVTRSTGTIAGDARSGVWTSWSSGAAVHVTPGRALTRVEFPPAFGAVGAIVSGPDGCTWVAARRGRRLARIAPDARVRLYRLGAPAGTVITDLSRRPGELLVAARHPAALYAVPLPQLRPLVAGG